jgi:hypothetical protein
MKRNLGIVAKMSLQLAGVVIARQIKLVKARNDPIIYDLDDIRLLHVFRHSADDSPDTHSSAVNRTVRGSL